MNKYIFNISFLQLHDYLVYIYLDCIFLEKGLLWKFYKKLE